MEEVHRQWSLRVTPQTRRTEVGDALVGRERRQRTRTFAVAFAADTPAPPPKVSA